MENLVILNFLFVGSQSVWIFEVLALVDVENSLGNKL